jgi:hypothetical protein
MEERSEPNPLLKFPRKKFTSLKLGKFSYLIRLFPVDDDSAP